MPDAQEPRRQKATNEARTSLQRVQGFDVTRLPRVEELGAVLNFKEATEPATKLISLYGQLSIDVLDSLPHGRLNTIKASADSTYQLLDSIVRAEPGTNKNTRDQMVQSLYDAYDPAFEAISEMISYSVRRSTDFEKLGRDARAVLQATRDEADSIKNDLQQYKRDANESLEAIRKVAAEQGVSQQAIHFKSEADSHESEAKKWLSRTVKVAIGLGIYAILTLFMHNLTWIKPQTTYETVQLSVSKVLIFGTIFFMLGLCAKNYLAHRHNAVVNRHRQNALATYTAIVKAANSTANSDIVLNRAADCIFSPQSTGYSKGDVVDSGSPALLTVGPNSVKAPGSP